MRCHSSSREYGDVTIISTTQRAVIVQGGKQVTGPDERVTRVYKKFGDQWRVIATHATPIRWCESNIEIRAEASTAVLASCRFAWV